MVDGALFLLLLNQMGYVLTGQQHHEGTGTVMVLLVLCHNLLNRRWFGAVGKGKYNSRRLFGTALNFFNNCTHVSTFYQRCHHVAVCV